MQHAITARETKIDTYLARLKEKDVPEDIASDLCRFGAIAVCGHLEQCVQIIILERLSPRAHHRVINFVKSYFKKGRNMKCSDIVALFERFDTGWGAKLKAFLEAHDEVVSAVESLYAIRNPLAHGASSSIGDSNLKRYFESVKSLTQAMIQATR
jgi:hypothetical protein